MPKQTLQHIGVLGMKWGRRKGRTPSEDHTSALSGLKGKQAHELSNAQIRKAAERIQLERQYKSLTTKEKSEGRKMVEEILNNQKRMIIASVVASASTLVVKTIMDNKSQILDAASQLIKIVPKSG